MGQSTVNYGWDDANRFDRHHSRQRKCGLGYDGAIQRTTLTLPHGARLSPFRYPAR
jgi:hypothetical protein